MQKCQSCREQNARYTLTLANIRAEVLDSVALCSECLTSSAILDVVSPGAVDTGEAPNVE